MPPVTPLRSVEAALARWEGALALADTEVEQSLLGALLTDNAAFERVADIVGPEDFSWPVYGLLYESIGKLIAEGIAANPVTLVHYLDGNSTVDRQHITNLADAVVSIRNAPYYAERIADLSRRRAIVAASQEAIADAQAITAERSADAVLDDAEERLFQIKDRREVEAGPSSMGNVVESAIKGIEASYKAGGIVTIDTGLAELDRIVSGMGAGDLVVLAGRPSMGKSAMAGTIAMNVAKGGKRVAIFSLEMSKDELARRWIAGFTGISTDRQRHGRIEQNEWQGIIEAGQHFAQLGIIIDDQARLSVAQMRQRSRRIRRRLGLDLIIIDHLQLIRQGGKQESRRLEIGDATSALKGLAKELRVPVLLLSQLNRAVESRENKRPVLSDLKESGDIEQDADVVMFLYREEYYVGRSEPRRNAGQTNEAHAAAMAEWDERCKAAAGLAEVEVAKNRHGKTGLAKLRFDGERQRFENLWGRE